MDARPGKPAGSVSHFSVASDHSKEDPPFFSVEEKTDDSKGRPKSPACLSLRSDMSRSLPPAFSDVVPETMKDRNAAPVGGQQAKPAEYDLSFPPLMEDWTKEHVKNWLTVKLRVPEHIAQNLYETELSGACLVSYEKQDLLELGVPPAPAIQIMRQVEKFKRQSETLVTARRASRYESREGESWKHTEMHDASGNMDESVEIETVSSDSGIQSLSSSIVMLQTARNKIRSVIDPRTKEDLPTAEITDDAAFLQLRRPISQIRPFDRSNNAIFYIQNDIFPPIAGPSNLLDPVHEYQLLPDANEASEREILYEFTKEAFSFAASCMNSRTNGTIHFGVDSEPGQGHGQVAGHRITSFSKYNEAFESCLSEYFDDCHVNVARMCIRPPKFIQVHCRDGTTSDKWVIEVDVVPTYSETKENLFYTLLSIASAGKKQQSKTACLFVRDGLRSINVLADTNPRVAQEKLKDLSDKVKGWASARKSAEENGGKRLSQSFQGQRLKQLIAGGGDALENSTQVIVVTDKCHSSQLEHMDFLKEMKVFAVLEFDPESDVNGTCSFYRRHHVANLHYPDVYTSQDSLSTVIGKLNLFTQTSWIFCNGRVNEESETYKPLTPNEWHKKRSGEVNNMISFLCSPDLLSKHQLLVVFVLHSVVADISSPILEAFCAIYRTLGGFDNMVCICKDAAVYSQWKHLIECRCKEDVTSKCIYDLSLNEISSTIKKLKEPQTQSHERYLPSTSSSSVLLAKKDEELMTVLDVLSENECENTEIETNDSFLDFKTKTEEDFYRGGKVSWWNFYLSEKPGCLPFIKRDKFNELYDLITPVDGHTSPCVTINLFHHPGCGGTTLAMHVLWNLRRKFRCAVVKNSMATNNEIAAQVMSLLTYGKQEQSSYTPVLLLVDNGDDVADLKQSILNVANDRKQHNNLMVIILNCERTQYPSESSRNSGIINVFITNTLSSKEQSLFSDKLQKLKDDHEKPETFYAFMIMTNNFSEDYISKLVSNTLKDLDTTTKQGRLFSFLALLNTYVNGSYMSLSLCEELLEIRNTLWGSHQTGKNIKDEMNPYSTLLINFVVEEHGTYRALRFLHQMIASNCLKVITEKHKLTLAEITINLLHCDRVYKSCMGKDFLVLNIQSMLITRHKKEQGDDKDTLFSPLIEGIHKEGPGKVVEVLERATLRFDRSATLPQALARHFCLNEKDFTSALKWALDARGKRSNSYISDTVGQVYKSHLKVETENSKDLTPKVFDKCLDLASKAVNAFRESQELAKTADAFDAFDIYHKKRHRSYNTSGYLGETEVIMHVLDVITELPVFPVNDRYKMDKVLQFLKGCHQVSSLYDLDNANVKEFVDVLANHEKFLVSLKPRLKEIFGFFENYFTYLRPRYVLLEKETVDERNKRKVSEYFKKYLQIFRISEKDKISEKANNPRLSLQQEIVDQRHYLETKHADSFAGLLQCLSDRGGPEMEHILKKWQFILDNSSSRYVSDTLNFILANLVLYSTKPNSKLLSKYEDLLYLLNEALQKEGTHSNLTELYYLSMLLMWPIKDQCLESSATYKNISTYVTSAKKSFHRRFSYMFPARSAIAHFFLGKSVGLKRIISKVRLDQILVSQRQSRNLHHLWQSGAVWTEKEIQNKLLRIKGQSENGDVYVNYGGNLKMLVRPAYLGDIRSGCSRETVYFYLGFTMEGPVAYDIRYEDDQ